MSLPANELAAEIEKHQGMIMMMAKNFSKYGVELDDLIQEGNISLLRAAKKFDPSRGWKFITYAQHWIRAFMGVAVERAHHAQNEFTRKVFWRGRKARAVLDAAGESYTNEDVARLVGVPVEHVDYMEMRAQAAVRIDKTNKSDHDLHAILGDGKESVEDALSRSREMKAFLEKFERVTKFLKPRDLAIFKLHYIDGWTYTDICKRYRISWQRCETIGKSTLGRLQRRMEIA